MVNSEKQVLDFRVLRQKPAAQSLPLTVNSEKQVLDFRVSRQKQAAQSLPLTVNSEKQVLDFRVLRQKQAAQSLPSTVNSEKQVLDFRGLRQKPAAQSLPLTVNSEKQVLDFRGLRQKQAAQSLPSTVNSEKQVLDVRVSRQKQAAQSLPLTVNSEKQVPGQMSLLQEEMLPTEFTFKGGRHDKETAQEVLQRFRGGAAEASRNPKACGKAIAWQSALVLCGRGLHDAIAYNAAISACGDATQWPWALHLFQEMGQKQLQRSQISFNAVVSAVGCEWPKALEICQMMHYSSPPG
eukprot:s1740_g9.t1